ncbi:hypothetical protein CMI40_01380 [Candidatus Pacearchaeota archaeon]|jgi:hypothetical protein|nr:hypothetical protein [Candidatus Pacearchaeota archaeon]|tara:strand:+ start:624 stop:1160 length:537 start_codon:yes stop_codon:yes gene_type:complete
MKKNKIIKDKRGGEKLFSIWWFFVLAIVGGAISIGVLMYYSADIDVREIEADILNKKIVDCIVDKGFLIEEIYKDNFDIYEKCKLNKDLIEGNNFYFKIQIFNELKEIISTINQPILGGNPSFERDCKFTEKVKAEHYLKCIAKKENILYYKNNKLKKGVIEIITASNQKGKEISITK